MNLSGYFMSNAVFVPAVSDSVGSTFKNNYCVESNKRRYIISAVFLALDT